jgi:type IV fimbrial biogenesis protein FimT
MKNRIHVSGFALIELLIVLAIVAVLLSVAVPSFNRQMEDSKAYNIRDRLATTFAYARSESVGLQEQITVCASTDGVNCGAVAGWSAWWLVQNAAGNTLRVVDISNYTVVVTVNQLLAVSVCFNAFGAECFQNFASVDFTITPPGAGLRPSILRLLASGTVIYL